jgi:hypothetical protein
MDRMDRRAREEQRLVSNSSLRNAHFPIMSEFEAASTWLTSSPSAGHLDNETKLELYGLYKFALSGVGP